MGGVIQDKVTVSLVALSGAIDSATKGTKTMRSIAVFLLACFALSAAPVFASESEEEHSEHGPNTIPRFIQRYDALKGDGPSFTSAVILENAEFWAYSYPDRTDLQGGYVTTLFRHHGLRITGGPFYSYWPEEGKHFFMPNLFAEYSNHRFQFGFDLLTYLPLNGGPTDIVSDEIWVGYRVTPHLRLGLAANFEIRDGELEAAGLGLETRIELGKKDAHHSPKTAIGIRYLFGVKAENSFRVQLERYF